MPEKMCFFNGLKKSENGVYEEQKSLKSEKHLNSHIPEYGCSLDYIIGQ